MTYSPTRMILAVILVGAYLFYWVNYGSPLLAFTTWMGWVDPQPTR